VVDRTPNVGRRDDHGRATAWSWLHSFVSCKRTQPDSSKHSYTTVTTILPSRIVDRSLQAPVDEPRRRATAGNVLAMIGFSARAASPTVPAALISRSDACRGQPAARRSSTGRLGTSTSGAVQSPQRMDYADLNLALSGGGGTTISSSRRIR